MASSKFNCACVGMAYRCTPATLRDLAKAAPLAVKLEREPDNEHDPNAVKVVITEKPFAKKHEGMHVGYVPRAIAMEFAPRMDRNEFPWDEVWLLSVEAEEGEGELLLQRKAQTA